MARGNEDGQGTSTFAVRGPRQTPALQIVWHPEQGRIGDVAHLVELERPGARVPVSGRAPTFAPATDGSDGSPAFDERHGDPPAFAVGGGPDGEIEIEPGGGKHRVKVNDEVLTAPRRLSIEELATGVVIAVAQRFVFVLRYIREPRASSDDLGLVGASDAIGSVRDEIRKVAGLDYKDVLIRGETGVGKEEVAKAITALSPRAGKPLVTVNMGALMASTALSELFGHERGAFTGAVERRDGQFVEADGGTLFLDEIGELAGEVQPMLLRALESREVQPLGSRQKRKVDVRILMATDANLEERIADKTFREALFRRLGHFTINVPPLRARREDVGPLLLHFLRREFEQAHEPRARTRSIGEWLPGNVAARAALMPWPRNVGELRSFASEVFIRFRERERVEVDDWLAQRLHRPKPKSAPAARPSAANTRRPNGMLDLEEFRQVYLDNDCQPAAVAEQLRISTKTVYKVLRENPEIGAVAKDVASSDLLREYVESGRDIAKLAKRLRTSARSIKARLAREGVLDPDFDS